MIDWIVSITIVACCIAVIIILAKWLIGLTGLAIPQPLLVVLAILLFLFVLLWFVSGGPLVHVPLRHF